MDAVLLTIGTVGIFVSAFESILFVLLYGFAAPWTKSAFGRFLFFSNAVLAIIFSFFVARIVFGDNPIFVYVRLIVFCMIPLYQGWLLWIFYRVQSQKEVPNGHRNP